MKRTTIVRCASRKLPLAAAAWEVVPRPPGSGFSFTGRVRAAQRKLLAAGA